MNTTLSKTIDKLPLTRVDKTNLKAGLEDLVNEGGSSSNLIKVTYKELKALRDTNSLQPGCWYRMTDYECIVAPRVEYKSAGHQFDLILLATDVNKLSENCKACRHEGDTYFPEDTNFEAWEVKYCLDNDSSRFNWAFKEGTYISTHIQLDLSSSGLIVINRDIRCELISSESTTIIGFPYKIWINTMDINVYGYINTIESDTYNLYIELPSSILPPGYPNIIGPFTQQFPITTTKTNNGKGVIYKLKDEHNNICDYDFKNILYSRYKIITTHDLEKTSDRFAGFWSIVDEKLSTDAKKLSTDATCIYFYTFSTFYNAEKIVDNSVFPVEQKLPIAYSNNNTITFNDFNYKGGLSNNVFIYDKIYKTDIDGYPPTSEYNIVNGHDNTFGTLLNCNLSPQCCYNLIITAYCFSISGNMWQNLIAHSVNTNIGSNFNKNIITCLDNSHISSDISNVKLIVPKNKNCYGLNIGSKITNLTIKSNTHIIGNIVLNCIEFDTERIVELNEKNRHFILRKGNEIAVYDIANLIPDSAII